MHGNVVAEASITMAIFGSFEELPECGR